MIAVLSIQFICTTEHDEKKKGSEMKRCENTNISPIRRNMKRKSIFVCIRRVFIPCAICDAFFRLAIFVPVASFTICSNSSSMVLLFDKRMVITLMMAQFAQPSAASTKVNYKRCLCVCVL